MTLSVRLRSAGSLVALAISAAPLVAQQPQAGTVEVNAGVRVSDVGMRNFSSVTSPTGLLGVFLSPRIAIETEISSANGRLSSTTPSVRSVSSYTPLQLRGVYNWPVTDNVAILLGAGAVRNEHRWLPPGPQSIWGSGPGAPVAGRRIDASEFSWHTMLGARLGLTDNVTFRGGVTVDGSSLDEGDIPFLLVDKRGYNIGGNFGVSYLFNTKPADADGDGVKDKADKCPNTPAGVKVNAEGCPIDTDMDGVADYLDKCANTPRGVTVDASGCPVDSDRDGVADFQDKCPNTPAGVRVNAEGCPLDSDGDGVADDRDRCPNTPRGEAVDANGCSLPKDADNDGVTDDKDRCPNTPAGSRVDANGCTVVIEGGRLTLRGVNFATGSSRLTPGSLPILKETAAKIKSALGNQQIQLEVGGHTDNTGRAVANTRLSQRRAASVVKYLEQLGIPKGILTAKGYGPSEPVADNKTRQGRALNRRVEIKQLP
ncbi:MAG: OmpA family protein [Gemmatimonadaceae bacterium]|nr:OmpA family protein [Gemmatimonadaceae bacterium]